MLNKELNKVKIATRFELERSPEYDTFIFNSAPIKKLIMNLTVVDAEIGYVDKKIDKPGAYTEYTRLEFLKSFKNAVEQEKLIEVSAKELWKRYIYIRENSSNKLADYRSLIDINLKIQMSR